MTFEWGSSLGDKDRLHFLELLHAVLDKPFSSVALKVISEDELNLIAVWPNVCPCVDVPDNKYRDNVWRWIRFDQSIWMILAGVQVMDWNCSIHLTCPLL